jgi:hypothetical protein
VIGWRGLGVFTALLVAVWLGVWGWSRTPGFTPFSVEERAAVMRELRGAVSGNLPQGAGGGNLPQGAGSGNLPQEAGRGNLPQGAALDRRLAGALVVTLYDRGAPLARVESRRPILGEAAREAADRLRAELDGHAPPIAPEVRARARLKVDAIVARAPIVTTIEPLFALSLEPGVDGLGLDFDGREVLLTSDDLMRGDLLASRQPTQAMEFELGADTGALIRRLASEVGASGAEWRRARKRFFRFRADQFVEPAAAEKAGAAPLEVVRGNPRKPAALVEPTRERLRAAAIAGGQYLLRHLDAEGRFGYEYYTLADLEVAGAAYSLPRHGGGAYFLAQLYGATRDPAFSDGARRALQFLKQRVPAGCDGERACVGEPDDRQVDIGAAALALTAAAEYQRATGDRAYEPWARRLANFIRSMQKPNGDFYHLYRPREDERDPRAKLLYYSGEAAFALAKLAQIPGGPVEPADLDALDRALDWLTRGEYDFFAGSFYFGEDHWTCLAADAAWERLPESHRLRYARFCDDFAKFLRRTQFTASDGVVEGQPDFAGAYGFSPLLPPHATPVGSRSEAMLSAYAIDRRLGEDGHETRAQIALGMRFLLAHQLDDDAGYLMPSPEAARGGILMSDVKRYIRIDFVQHSCSAMLRAAEIFAQAP